MTNNKSLDHLFKPRNVAIYEAKEKFFYFIEGFRSQGFDLNKLYLINPSVKEISGIKCYNSIKDVPSDTIDLLILAIGRDKLIQSLEAILEKKKIKFIHFFTAGTGEFDEIGKEIEEQIKEVLDRNHIDTQAIGPNSMGVYCPKGKNAYLPIFPKESGNIGLIFHSGDLLSRTIIYGAIRYNLRFSKGVSAGNCINLQISDYLEFLSQDNDTDVICIYFEGFTTHKNLEGRKLLNLLKYVKKPVLFLRGGRTKRGQSTVLTHTGSLGSKEKIWHAIYKQTRLIEVKGSLDELIDYLYMFYEFFKKNQGLASEEMVNLYPKGKNVLIITWSGGMSVLDVDSLTELKLNLPLFEGKAKEKLLEAHPNFKVGSLSNPLDLPWISSTKEYLDICKAAISENIDLVIIYKDQDRTSDDRSRKRYDNLLKIKEHTESLNKILLIITPEYPDRSRTKYYKKLIKDGFMVYPDIRRAAKAFLAFYEFGQKIKAFMK
ncbi:MAG: CoA-binding protein [Promethearchaeota archaeon]